MPVLLQPSTYPSARAAYPLVHARDDDPTTNASAGNLDDKAPLGGPFGPATDIDTAKFSIPLTITRTVQTFTLGQTSTIPTTSSTPTVSAQSTVTVVKVIPPTSAATDQTGSSTTDSQQSSATSTAASSTTTQQTLATSTASQTQATSTSPTDTSSVSSSAAQQSSIGQQGPSSSSDAQVASTTQPPKVSSTPADDGATQEGGTTFVTVTLPGGQTSLSAVAANAVQSEGPKTSLAPVGGAKSTNAVSPAVIAVPIILIFLIFIGVGVFLFRRHSLAKRQRKRNTWGAGLYPQAPPTSSFGSTDRAYEEARAAGMAPNAYAAAPPPPPMMQFTPAPLVAPPLMMSMAPPPQAYNSPAMLTPNMSPYSAIGPGAPMGGFGAGAIVPSGAAAQASVKCAFVPSMPDELSIFAGESIRLLAEYDDGWALCENTRGEQGMVPLDCLDRGLGVPSTPTSTASFNGSRSQRRASSLVGAGIRGPMQY